MWRDLDLAEFSPTLIVPGCRRPIGCGFKSRHAHHKSSLEHHAVGHPHPESAAIQFLSDFARKAHRAHAFSVSREPPRQRRDDTQPEIVQMMRERIDEGYHRSGRAPRAYTFSSVVEASGVSIYLSSRRSCSATEAPGCWCSDRSRMRRAKDSWSVEAA